MEIGWNMQDTFQFSFIDHKVMTQNKTDFVTTIRKRNKSKAVFQRKIFIQEATE